MQSAWLPTPSPSTGCGRSAPAPVAPVVPALVALSADADMVVVGCRGLGGVGRLLLGSVSSGLVHGAHCPVAVIRDEDPLMPDPAHAPVVVGIDGSPASELATEIAFEEATRRGVELVAVHVWSDRSDDLATPYWATCNERPKSCWPGTSRSGRSVTRR